jgi:Adaptor complexes medium subunit family
VQCLDCVLRAACAQVFLDVVESVNLLVNSNGTVVRSEVVGALKMRTYLSGMPECKLGLNDKVRPHDCAAAGVWYVSTSSHTGIAELGMTL